MFDTFNDLPVHPLVVHGVVVLLPLAILGTIAIALRPAWRRAYGPLVIGIAAVATALIPVATESGEKLATHVGEPADHAELGESLIWFALPLLALAVALVILDRRGANAEPASGALSVVNIVAAVAVLAGIAAGVQVYRVGDSGAKAVWQGKTDNVIPTSAQP